MEGVERVRGVHVREKKRDGEMGHEFQNRGQNPPTNTLPSPPKKKSQTEYKFVGSNSRNSQFPIQIDMYITTVKKKTSHL